MGKRNPKSTRKCAICALEYFAYPSDPPTCSRECGGKLSGASRSGKPHRWSKSAKKRLALRGQTRNLKMGTPAAKLSPIAGPYETNQEAKIWHLRRLADGKEWAVRNLRKFCRDHPELFSPSRWDLAYAGLRQVQASIIGMRKGRNVSRYKGWTLVRPAEPVKDGYAT